MSSTDNERFIVCCHRPLFVRFNYTGPTGAATCSECTCHRLRTALRLTNAPLDAVRMTEAFPLHLPPLTWSTRPDTRRIAATTSPLDPKVGGCHLRIFSMKKKNPRPEMNFKANQTGQQFISPHWHDLAATSGLMMGGHDLPGFFNLPLDLVCLPIHATSAKLGRAPAGWLCGRLLRHTRSLLRQKDSVARR